MMRERCYNRVERAERVEKGLGVSSQELGLAAKNTKSAKPWPMVRLGDVCEIKGGFAFKSKEYTSSGLQVVRISDLCGNEISAKDAVYYPETVGLEKFVIDEACILICLTGSIGKMALVTDGVKRYLNQRVGLLTCGNQLLLKYVWCFLHSEDVIASWENAKTSVNGNLRNSDITELQIPLPPLEVQREIVERLEKELGEADKVAAEFKRMVELADKEFKAELDEVFSALERREFLTQRRKGAESAESACPMVRLGDVCKKVARLKDIEDSVISYIDISSVDRATKKVVETKEYDRKSAPGRAQQVVEKNDVLVSTVRPNLNAVAIVENSSSNQLIASTGFCVLRANEQIQSRYIYYFVQDGQFIGKLVAVSEKASYPSVTDTIVKDVYIPLPPLSVQKGIVAKLDAAKEMCEKLKAEAERGLKAAENLRKAILSEAFE